ncbi:MAG TPA: hypothetical protein VK112_11500 [Fodinibius sp.]|nr:hypothetical protein [Fodinibius sp.]
MVFLDYVSPLTLRACCRRAAIHGLSLAQNLIYRRRAVPAHRLIQASGRQVTAEDE